MKNSLNADAGGIGGSQNTPANDNWTMSIHFMRSNSSNVDVLRIVYLATGEIDIHRTPERDFWTANVILFPWIQLLKSVRADFDIWTLLNWIFVTCYWLTLADLGQESPTLYAPLKDQSYIRDDLSTGIQYPSRNNIFMNNTLFTTYSSFLQDVILPLLLIPSPSQGFAPLDIENRFQASPTTFRRSYICTTRQWKAPLSAMFAILVTIYTFISGGYTLFIMCASWYQRRKDMDGRSRFYWL